MDTATIKVVFGSTNLDLTITPNKQFVIALVAFLNVEIPKLYDDPTAQIITGLSDQLNASTDELQKAQNQGEV